MPHRDEQGRVDGIIGYFRNVTERKQAEAELTRLASFPALNLRPILEIGLDGQVEFANPASRKAFPDLSDKIMDHPYFAGWPEIVEKAHHDPDLVIQRDVQVGKQYFQQSIHYVKEYDRLRVYGSDITERVHTQQALTESQTLLRTLMQEAPDPIFMKDRDSRMLLANPATLAVIGKSAEQVMGKNDKEFYDDPAVGAAIMDNDRRIMASGRTEVVEERIVTPELERIYLSTKTPYRDSQGQVIGVIGVSRDITDRINKEAELNRLNRTLKALSNINQAMLRASNETDYMQEVCRIVVEDCGHAMVWIGNVEHDEGKTIRPVASSGFEAGYLETLRLTWADTERGRGPSGTAIRTGKMSMCKNMLTDPQFIPWRAEAIKRGYASSIVFPLFADGEVFGELTIYSRDSDPFSEDEIKLLTELSSDLAYGISLLRLREAHTQTEAALAINEERYRTLFNGMTEGFALHEIVCNENGHPIDYRFLEMNPAFERLTGLERSKLEGQLKSVTMPGDDPYWLEVYAKVAYDRPAGAL